MFVKCFFDLQIILGITFVESVGVETECIFDMSLIHCCQSKGTLHYFPVFKKKELNHYLKLFWGIKKEKIFRDVSMLKINAVLLFL